LTSFWRPPIGWSGRYLSSKHPVHFAGNFKSISVTLALTISLSLGEFRMRIVEIVRLTEAERVVHLPAQEGGGLGHYVTLGRQRRFMRRHEA
jgi:hypothetical protein